MNQKTVTVIALGALALVIVLWSQVQAQDAKGS